MEILGIKPTNPTIYQMIADLEYTEGEIDFEMFYDAITSNLGVM